MTWVASAASIVAIVLLFSTAVAQGRAARNRSGGQSSLSASEVVNGDYFCLRRDGSVAGTINGDLYASGGRVVVDGYINGDFLVAGGKVRLLGTVSQDVRAAGGTVTITGGGRNLTVAGGDVELAPSAVVRGRWLPPEALLKKLI